MAVERKAILDRVDKNGSKHYHSNACPKCGGTGYLPGYEFIDGARCWECNATGYHPHSWVEHTPEYAAKLLERRLAKTRAKAPEINRKLFVSQGFSEDGIAWFPIGNTYAIKDKLREAGARYNETFGWHFDYEPADYKTFKLDIRDVCIERPDGLYALDRAYEIVNALREAYRPKSTSEWVGTVGAKFASSVIFDKYYMFESHFTYRGETNYIYHFHDETDNIIIWKTSKCLALDAHKMYSIVGTVKEHSEYKGDKQTVLTRCTIV